MTAPAPILSVTVPGPWQGRSELVSAVRKAGEGYVVAGRHLKHAASGQQVPMSVVEHDPDLAAAFAEQGAAAGIESSALAIAQTHSRAARVAVQAEGVALASQVLAFSAALIRGGGCAVRVDSGRRVHSAHTWLQLASQPNDPRALYTAFVSLAPMPDGSCYYSTGMQAMNLPDAAAPADLSAQQASEVLGTFLIHCFANRAELADGRMFRPRETQHFRMRFADCNHFPPGHPQHNPHGLWHLR